MIRVTAAVVGIGFCSLASAEPVTYAEVKAKNATRLSAGDLKRLMPGAKVVSRSNAGSTRHWQNRPDGTLVASSDNKGSDGRARPTAGNGTWRVSDKGAYCVTIKWNMASEAWCRYIVKAGDKLYAFAKLESSAQASELEFSK
jgi:Protein of unknown function (DUF995)